MYFRLYYTISFRELQFFSEFAILFPIKFFRHGMKDILPETLKRLAESCPAPLYLVGGSVRDFLLGYPLGEKADWDIASPMDEDTFVAAAEARGFSVRAVYRRTGTVKLEDGEGRGYEYTRFRSDRYLRGEHTPSEIFFTEDMTLDARRRDFCANAVYYDIAGGKFADPLGGTEDIARGVLRTVREGEKVFGEDGLRLVRLARISAETGLVPDGECLAGAKRNAALIGDISPERIFTEMKLLLLSDQKHGDAEAPLRGLRILRDTGVLAGVMPELALGDGMEQNTPYHVHDVLEHSFLCVRHAPPEIRFAALLHDVGKPFCKLRDGNFYAHAQEGARIAEDILTRLKAPKKLTEETVFLVKNHMRDFDCKMREAKVRREIVAMGGALPALLALKQADFSACKGDPSPAPTVVKWQGILAKMREEGVPFTLRELAVNGRDLQHAGIPERDTATALHELLNYCAEDGARNQRERLLKYAAATFK